MKNKIIIILLLVMILLSLFSGISVNGNWGFIYQFEFIDFLELRETEFKDFLIWGFVILSHIGIALLPFFVRRSYFKNMLLYFPLIYLLGYLILEAMYFVLLIPFMVVWLITLRMLKSRNV